MKLLKKKILIFTIIILGIVISIYKSSNIIEYLLFNTDIYNKSKYNDFITIDVELLKLYKNNQYKIKINNQNITIDMLENINTTSIDICIDNKISFYKGNFIRENEPFKINVIDNIGKNVPYESYGIDSYSFPNFKFGVDFNNEELQKHNFIKIKTQGLLNLKYNL